jgi:hypothetical protein
MPGLSRAFAKLTASLAKLGHMGHMFSVDLDNLPAMDASEDVALFIGQQMFGAVDSVLQQAFSIVWKKKLNPTSSLVDLKDSPSQLFVSSGPTRSLGLTTLRKGERE